MNYDAASPEYFKVYGCAGARLYRNHYCYVDPQMAPPTYRQQILLYVLDEVLQHYVLGPISAPYLLPVALESKMADAYKRVDLQSYGARNGASLSQSFKYKFGFPSMYRRLKSTRLNQCYERKQI